jgi:hypothetical protein
LLKTHLKLLIGIIKKKTLFRGEEHSDPKVETKKGAD